jgi:hypothetical protein
MAPPPRFVGVAIEHESTAQADAAKALRAAAKVEQLIGKLKRFKRVAMRCEKTKLSFASLVAWAFAIISVKSVHMAWDRIRPQAEIRDPLWLIWKRMLQSRRSRSTSQLSRLSVSASYFVLIQVAPFGCT